MSTKTQAKTDDPEIFRCEPPPGPVTFEEYLDWLDEDTWAEWVQGEITVFSPAAAPHQELTGFLYSLIKAFAEDRDCGSVYIPPFVMKLGGEHPLSGREPDVLFVAREHLDRVKKAYLDGPADLVVEVISPDSRTRDRKEKFAEYARLGVPEYWLIDHERDQAEFYRLGPDAAYEPIAVDSNGIVHSQVLPGFWLDVNWLWQEPLPRLMDVLEAWGLIKWKIEPR